MTRTLCIDSVEAPFFKRRLIFVVLTLLLFASSALSPSFADAAGPNLISNPGVETSGATAGLPANWLKGGYGTNARTLTYPVTGNESSKALRVSISSYTSGDAKWYFPPVTVKGLTAYEFSDVYQSDTTSYVTLQFRHADGTTSYLDIGRLAASSSWKTFSASFTTPANVTGVTVFHLIKSVGYLETDNFFLGTVTSDPTKFDKGYVSIQFDDGWKDTYNNAYPILDTFGFKTNAFIITGRMKENDFPGFVKANDVLAMQSNDHEIGAHTRSHGDLTTLTSTAARAEIEGSRNDLLQIGAKPIDLFAYPFGAYNASVKQIVKDAGFSAARSSDGGYNSKNQDRYALKRQPMLNTTSLSTAKKYIDTALAEHTWVILLFHQVNSSGGTYTVTPERFTEILEYLEQKGVTPITMSEGINLMNQ